MDKLKYELDKTGKIGVTLKEFVSLREMDTFLSDFHNSSDVREYFIDKINEFLMSEQATNYLNVPAKNNSEKNGYIVCYHEYPYHNLKRISALYDNTLINKNINAKLREELKKYNVLKQIYKRKYFLIPSAFLKDELERILDYNGGKTPFIDGFIKYINNLKEEEKYIYLRSLCNICNLLEKKKKKEKIDFKVINVSAIKDINEYQLVRNRLFNMDFDDNNEYMVYDDAPEYFKYVFNKAVKDNNFEMLFNMFDIEEISLYSNYYEKGKVK